MTAPEVDKIRSLEAADLNHGLADQEVLLSRSGLTRLVDRLERAGLLRREADPTDRRGSYAVLTDDGYDAVRRTWPRYARGIQEHFARHLQADEATPLAQALDRVAATEAP